MNRFNLKILMVIFMLMDHMAYFIPGIPIWFRFLGRVVTPIFIFLLVEGYFNTKDKQSYLKRLVLGAQTVFLCNSLVITIMPKLIDTNGVVVKLGHVFNIQSYVMVALTLIIVGAAMLNVYKDQKLSDEKALINIIILVVGNVMMINAFSGQVALIYNNILQSLTLSFLLLNVLSAAEKFTNKQAIIRLLLITILALFSEGMIVILMLTIIFYRYRDTNKKKYIIYGIISLLYISSFSLKGLLLNPQWMMIFAIPFMMLYNGEKGKDNRLFFYIFYPAHIVILYAIGFFLINK